MSPNRGGGAATTSASGLLLEPSLNCVLTFARLAIFRACRINTPSANLRHYDLDAASRALTAARHILLAQVPNPRGKKGKDMNAEDFRASLAEKAPREALSAPLAAGRAH